MATAEVTINLADIDEVGTLIRTAVALDNVVAEFGLDNPVAIREAYQRFHDALNALAIASAARAVARKK